MQQTRVIKTDKKNPSGTGQFNNNVLRVCLNDSRLVQSSSWITLRTHFEEHSLLFFIVDEDHKLMEIMVNIIWTWVGWPPYCISRWPPDHVTHFSSLYGSDQQLQAKKSGTSKCIRNIIQLPHCMQILDCSEMATCGKLKQV